MYFCYIRVFIFFILIFLKKYRVNQTINAIQAAIEIDKALLNVRNTKPYATVLYCGTSIALGKVIEGNIGK